MTLALCCALLAAACTGVDDVATNGGTDPLGPTATEPEGAEPEGADATTDATTQPPATASTLPETPTLPPLPTRPPPPDPVTVLAVGNLSECGDRDAEVGALIDGTEGIILSTGDLAPLGTDEFLTDCFLPLYSDDLDRLLVVPGNQDLATENGAAFYDVVGRTMTESDEGKGWFVTTLGAWQIIGLTSRCADVGGCGVGSEQYRWLDEVLRSDQVECRLAVWHDPRFTSAVGVDDAGDMGPIYGRLHGAGLDLVLSGGPANYERLGPLRPNGEPFDDGVLNFVVGTGGAGSTPFDDEPRDGSWVRLAGLDGFLLIELTAEGYRWDFVATPESVQRSGSEPNEGGSGTC